MNTFTRNLLRQLLLGILLLPFSVAAQNLPPDQTAAITAAKAEGVTVRWNAARGEVASIRGADLGARSGFSRGYGLQLARNATYEQRAIAVLDNVSGMLRASNASREFRAKRTQSDKLGYHHVRVEQRHNNLRVVGAELIVHFDKQDRAYEVNGRYISGITLSVAPQLSSGDALLSAQADLLRRGSPTGALQGEPELVVFARRTPARLAYQLTLTYGEGTSEPGRWIYWVDAQTGRVMDRVSKIFHIAAPTTNGLHTAIFGVKLAGEGGGATNVMGWKQNTNNKYYLYNTNQQWVIKNAAASGWPDASSHAFRDTDDWGVSDPTEISAALAMDAVHRYFRDVHGLPSFDGDNSLARANVHQGTNYVNAYWDGEQLYIGDGNGVDANSLAVLDIIGHEFAHAVTERSADLIYYGESGALNESFSDIFGTSIEFHTQPDDRDSYPSRTPGMADWLLGEDSWLASTALRDMRDPTNTDTVGEDNEQPTRYLGSFWESGEDDLGGVHQNSGVQNFFYYLLSEGGSGTNDGLVYDVSGIGITNAEQIAFRTLTLYCTEDTDYRDVRLAWQSAALDLNDEWASVVAAAWEAVGVTALTLWPEVGIAFVGARGGPFHPSSFVYTLYNDDLTNHEWSISANEPWLEVSPTAGEIEAMSSAAITVTVNSAANALPTGDYFGTLVFTNSLSGPAIEYEVTLRVMPPSQYEFDLDNDPGWTTSGQWEFGEPTGNGADEAGYPDPTSGVTGENVYGVNLDGDYAILLDGPHYLTTEPLNFSDLTNVHFAFSRWLNTDFPPYVSATIEVSTDGTNWITVWANEEDVPIAESAWSEFSMNISEYADEVEAFYIRWGYEVADNLAYPYSGWNIDDIRFYADSRDAMRIAPRADFRASGYEGGPFTPDTIEWTVSNTSTSTLEWTVARDAAWLDLSSMGGELEGGASTSVVASLSDSIANALSPDTYAGSVVFSNSTSGFSAELQVELRVRPIPGVIEVRDSIAPEDDLKLPFGDVIIGTERTETITISNSAALHPLTIETISLTGFSEVQHSIAELRAESLPIRGAVQSANNGTAIAAEPLALRWSQVGAQASAVNILIYADDPRHRAPNTYIDQALQAMGLPYEAYYEDEYEDFEAALTNGGQWDLVILAADYNSAPESTLDLLLNYVDSGGRLIAHAWNMGDGHPLWERMAASFVEEITEPPQPIYWWEPGHALFNQPEEVPEFTGLSSNVFGIYGQYVEPVNDGVALAGYTTTATVDRAALIVANNGRTIFRGFMDGNNNADLDADGVPDGVELWENLINYSLAGLTFQFGNVPLLPLTLQPGEFTTLSVTYAPQRLGTNYGEVLILSDDATAPTNIVELSGAGVSDPLIISPRSGLVSIGRPGGPFDPAEIVYAFTNTAEIAMSWSASSTQDWVSVSPASGVLAPEEAQSVTVQIVAANAPLVDGGYSDLVVFSNETTGATHKRPVELTVYTAPIIEVAPQRIDVTNYTGHSLARELVVSNSVAADATLSFHLVVRATEQPHQELRQEQRNLDVPPNHDFTRVAQGVDFVQGELLVRFASGTSTLQREQTVAALGGTISRRTYALVKDLRLVRLGAGRTVEDALPAFNAAPGVLYAEPNYLVRANETVPDDPRFGELWGMKNAGQSGGTVGADIRATDAWEVNTGDGSVIVAISDSGVDYNHEDLAANMWINSGEIPGNGIDDDGNGYVDDVYGINAVTGSGDPMDDHNHGTHVAGTIGAVGNNSIGVAGVSWNVQLMAVKFLKSNGYGSTGDGILTIDYAVANGARVINASWGGGGYSQALKDSLIAAGDAGVLFCAAAGNDNEDIADHPNYPASFHLTNMIVVMSTDRNDNRSSFSTYGATGTDIAAPGSSILSTRRGGGYMNMSGTSMATPHVSGAAALLLSINPLLGPVEIRQILMETSNPVVPGLNLSGGRLDLAAAVNSVTPSWLTVDPVIVSNVSPGSAAAITVGFLGDNLAPGDYKADIQITSNDRTNSVVTIPVTMKLVEDGLLVMPSNTFETAGFHGGPFIPRLTTYVLTNRGDVALQWAASGPEWITLSTGGTLEPGASTQIVVEVNSLARFLLPGTYDADLVFSNIETGVRTTRDIHASVGGGSVWINEVNLFVTNAPHSPFVELAGVAGTDLSIYALLFVDENGDEVYTNLPLSGIIDNEGCGFGAVAFELPSENDEPPMGIVLLEFGPESNTPIQFVSFAEPITISNEQFGALSSEVVGTNAWLSLDFQLWGTGDRYDDFVWQFGPPSPGQLNGLLQEITPCASDRDNDQLPDWWEQQYGLDPTVSNPPSSNLDSDWMTDWEEYLADTDPSDPNSVFPLVVVTNPPRGVIDLVVDPSSTARVYGVYMSTNLLTDPQRWGLLPPEQLGTGGEVIFTITNDAPIRSYRTGVRLP